VIRFVLHPGFVISPNDGDQHKVSAPQLAQLYGVRMSECIVIDPDQPETFMGRDSMPEYLHLFPSDHGGRYWPISETERFNYPKRELAGCERVDDCVAKGRQDHAKPARGEHHGRTKLTEQDVREIRALHGVIIQRDVAQMYGISKSQVERIQYGKSWVSI
jgi:hypothetical protein